MINDQEIKLPIYAENKVNELWLINLNNDAIAPKESIIEVYRYPQNNYYQQRQILTKKDTISCLAFPEITMEVNQLVD